MKKRFIAAAVPVLVAGSLAAAAPSMSQAADKDDAQTPPKVSAKVAAAEIAPCAGGKQKKAVSTGHSGWTWTDSSATIPGGLSKFRGPSSGKDTVFVTLTAHHTFASTNDYARVRVLLDGVEMNPTQGNQEYFYSMTNYGSLAGQYCGKIQGGGFHRVRVILDSFDGSGDGSDTAYLNNPMVNVEVAD